MDAHIKKVYVPMTETSFYILLCLRTPNHGYGIVQKVKELADDFKTQVIGTLSHSELVAEAEEEGKTVMECFPGSEMAEEYRKLAEVIYELSKESGEGWKC